jgi:soluble lytic murein transglycosylase-like protein
LTSFFFALMKMIVSFQVCGGLFTQIRLDPTRASTQIQTCYDVANIAQQEGLDPILAVAVAFTESRLIPTAESSEGAVGAMQVIPKYCCPNRKKQGCDLIKAGVNTLQRLKTRHKQWDKTLCHYNNGNKCYPSGKGYARHVLAYQRKIAKNMGNNELLTKPLLLSIISSHLINTPTQR